MSGSWDDYIDRKADEWMTDDWRALYEDASASLPEAESKEEALANIDDRIDDLIDLMGRIREAA